MSFRDVYRVSNSLEVVTEEEVRAVERDLGVTFPAGYLEYVTTLGKGVYCGYVHVFMPTQIQQAYQQKQTEWETNLGWPAGEKILSRKQVVESFILAETTDGDDLIFHPQQPDKLFVLANTDAMIYDVGADLEEALNWLYEAGVLTPHSNFKYFHSQKNLGLLMLRASNSRLSFGDLRDYLLSLGAHQHVIMDTEEGFIQLFYSDFGGFISAFTFIDRKIRIDVEYDLGQETETLKTLLAYLTAAGFQIYH